MCNFSSAKTKGKRYYQPTRFTPTKPSTPHTPAESQTQEPYGLVLALVGGSQPPKGEKLYRYNGIAERTIRCVFARRFHVVVDPRRFVVMRLTRARREGMGEGGETPKYVRIMPNISADNCADYEVNLSAAKRMSRHSSQGGGRLQREGGKRGNGRERNVL